MHDNHFERERERGKKGFERERPLQWDLTSSLFSNSKRGLTGTGVDDKAEREKRERKKREP